MVKIVGEKIMALTSIFHVISNRRFKKMGVSCKAHVFHIGTKLLQELKKDDLECGWLRSRVKARFWLRFLRIQVACVGLRKVQLERPDVPFDPGGFNSKTKLDDEFLQRQGV